MAANASCGKGHKMSKTMRLTGILLPAHIWAVRDSAIGKTEPDGLVEALAEYASVSCSNHVERSLFHSDSRSGEKILRARFLSEFDSHFIT